MYVAIPVIVLLW